MKLKPFFSYFGAKNRLVDLYPKPRHKTIIEPFAGSASYALRYFDRNVILYDMNPVIVSVWDYIIKSKEIEINKLPTKISHLDDFKLPQEARWLIGYWLAKGNARPSLKPSKWANIAPSSFWGEEVKQRIIQQQQFIRHWKIFQKCYTEILENSKPRTYFIDPPYETEGKNYGAFSGNNIDFKSLAKWCKSLDGQVIVCEANDAKWLPFVTLKENHAVNKKITKELIWSK